MFARRARRARARPRARRPPRARRRLREGRVRGRRGHRRLRVAPPCGRHVAGATTWAHSRRSTSSWPASATLGASTRDAPADVVWVCRVSADELRPTARRLEAGVEVLPRAAWPSYATGSGDLGRPRPETFMNESGRSVAALRVRFFEARPGGAARRPRRGRLRPRPARAGATGGLTLKAWGRAQRGCGRSRASSGTPDFLRLRVGVGRPSHERGDFAQPLADYVLSDFQPADDGGDDRAARAADAVEVILRDCGSSRGGRGLQRRYNW